MSFSGTASTVPAKLKMTYVRTTCSPNCTGACGLKAGVLDGQIKTIIQAADYPDKEYNPRGCLKGLSMTNLIYGPDRLKTPLISNGTPGKGDFSQVSWEEALNYTGKLRKLGKIRTGTIGSFSKSAEQVCHKGAVSPWRLFPLDTASCYDQNGDMPGFG
jgi:anaerobic selenocysteine-containing dehydrogenase